MFREESKLNELLKYLNKQLIKKEDFGIEDKSKTYNKNLVELLEFRNILEISESIIKSAISREESRGGLTIELILKKRKKSLIKIVSLL